MISCNGCKKRAVLEVEQETVKIVETEKILFDQGSVCVANRGVPSSYYQGMMAYTRGLDDFLVPSGKTWHISSMTVMGSWFGDSHLTESTSFGITVFNRGFIVCRSDITVKPFTTESEGHVTFLLLDSPCVVVGGHLDSDKNLLMNDETYYVTVFPRLDYGNGANSWHWSLSKTTNGENFKFRDTENVLQNGYPCKQWTDATKCGLQLEGASDLCFQFSGFSVPSTPDDWNYLDLPPLPITDGNIGTDLGHGRLLTVDEAEQRKSSSDKFAVSTSTALADRTPERIRSVNGGTPAYAIALIVVASLALVAIAIVIVVKVVKSREQTERV